MRGKAARSVLALALAAVMLSGCADAEQGTGARPSTQGPSGTGTLAGVVVDDAIRPIEGALIQVMAMDVVLNATTGTDGGFRFEDLQPGAYRVRASKAYYSSLEQAVIVATGVKDPAVVRFQLVFEASSVPFASVYKYEGLHECGFNFIRVCSNINIATSIVLCSYHESIPCFNVTTDSSLFFQRIDGIPSFIQAELVWDATTDTGRALNFVIGGGNQSELQSGFASGYNFTGGESPLMLRITNHEGENSWCYQNVDDCEVPETLNYTRIGAERALLGQVDAGPTQDLGTCSMPIRPCQVGFSVQQRFTMFTIVFYGYEPPDEWRFADTGEPPAPPA